MGNKGIQEYITQVITLELSFLINTFFLQIYYDKKCNERIRPIISGSVLAFLWFQGTANSSSLPLKNIACLMIMPVALSNGTSQEFLA